MRRIRDFFVEDDSIAAAVVPRWFASSRILLPGGTFGYRVLPGCMEGEVFDQGSGMDVRGCRAAWVFRSGGWALVLRLPGLTTRDGVTVDVTLELTAEIPPSARALRQFLAGRPWPQRVTAADVAGRISGAIRDSFGRRLGQESLVAVAGMDGRRARELLADSGEEVFFERGMAVAPEAAVSVCSPESEELQARGAELELEEERVRGRLRFIDLWKRQEMGETLARRDVEALASYLKQEGVIKELEREDLIEQRKREREYEARQSEQQLRHLLERRELEHTLEIDARRLDEEIERTRRMSEVLREGGIETHLFQLKDETVKGRLYGMLLERDMTPEQIRARSAGMTADDVRELGASLRELVAGVRLLVERSSAVRERPGSLTPGQPASRSRGLLPIVRERSAGRLFVVAGGSIHVVYAEGAPGASGMSVELPFGDAGLGQLRSVRGCRTEDGLLLLAGARDGVCVRRLLDAPELDAESRAERLERDEVYRLEAGDRRTRGGVNAAALQGVFVLASHSERGLVRWARFPGGLPEVLDTPGGSPHALRGIQVGHGGLIWYARGAEIVARNPDAPRHVVRRLAGAGEEVTSFAIGSVAVLAGTRRGRLLRWILDGTDRPEVVAAFGPRAVYMIRSIDLDGEGFFLAGAGTEDIIVCAELGSCERLLAAPRPVSWVGACGQRAYAVDRRFHVLYLWDRRQPDRPPCEVRFAQKIRDLWVDLESSARPGGPRQGVREEGAP